MSTNPSTVEEIMDTVLTRNDEDVFVLGADGEIIFQDPDLQAEYELNGEPIEDDRVTDWPDEKLYWK